MGSKFVVLETKDFDSGGDVSAADWAGRGLVAAVAVGARDRAADAVGVGEDELDGPVQANETLARVDLIVRDIVVDILVPVLGRRWLHGALCDVVLA